MHSQKVDLGQRVVELEDLGEVVDNLAGGFERKPSLLLQAFGGINSDWKLTPALVLALGEALDILKLSECPRIEVRAHLGSRDERDLLETIAQAHTLLLGLVRKRSVRLWDCDGKVEGRLQGGLVKARECAAGVA